MTKYKFPIFGKAGSAIFGFGTIIALLSVLYILQHKTNKAMTIGTIAIIWAALIVIFCIANYRFWKPLKSDDDY